MLAWDMSKWRRGGMKRKIKITIKVMKILRIIITMIRKIIIILKITTN